MRYPSATRDGAGVSPSKAASLFCAMVGCSIWSRSSKWGAMSRSLWESDGSLSHSHCCLSRVMASSRMAVESSSRRAQYWRGWAMFTCPVGFTAQSCLDVITGREELGSCCGSSSTSGWALWSSVPQEKEPLRSGCTGLLTNMLPNPGKETTRECQQWGRSEGGLYRILSGWSEFFLQNHP